jgi:hypothetical protein
MALRKGCAQVPPKGLPLSYPMGQDPEAKHEGFAAFSFLLLLITY